MKRKLWRLRLVIIPAIALGVLFIAFPYLTLQIFAFGFYPRTTIFIYLGVTIFLSLLRLKGSYTNKTLDQVVTILMYLIVIPVLLILGIPFFFIAVIVRPFMYRIMYFLATTILYVFGIRLEFVGKLPKGQYIIICNHCSTIDDIINAPIMGLKGWKVVFAPEVRRIPLVSLFLMFIGIPVKREDLESKEEVKGAIKFFLEKKFNILIFPEGKRLTEPRKRKKDVYILPFQKGAFFLSQKTGIPVVRVVVSWTYLFKPRAGQWWFSPRKITIKYLDPILIEEGETIGDFANRARLSMETELRRLIDTQ